MTRSLLFLLSLSLSALLSCSNEPCECPNGTHGGGTDGGGTDGGGTDGGGTDGGGTDGGATDGGGTDGGGTDGGGTDGGGTDGGGTDGGGTDGGGTDIEYPYTDDEMEPIPAGTFTMGCTDGAGECFDHESPAHEVTLTRDFYIGRTEVTQGQYEELMGTNPSYFTSCGTDCPVEKVTWHMAADFARTLSMREGLEECYACVDGGSSTSCEPIGDPYDCGGYRLPTEAEWEYAARCGEDLLYAGSDDVGAVAWYSGNASTGPRVVATKAANACGLYDMSGNVEEWVGDNYGEDYYTYSPDVDPIGPSTGSRRGERGGNWNADALYVRVADRRALPPEDRYNYVGFRLARTAL